MSIDNDVLEQATPNSDRQRSRAVWAFVDQGLSSLSNVTVTLAVARLSSPREFGGYAAVYVAYVLFLQISRAMTSEPLVIRFSGSSRMNARAAAGSAGAVVVLAGLGFALLLMMAGVIIGSPIEMPALIFGAGLPLLLLQDFWRYTFFTYGTPKSAAFNDALWLGIQIAGFVAVSLVWNGTAGEAMVVWVGGGVVSSLVGALQARAMPTFSGVTAWFKTHSDLIPRYCAEVVLQRGAVQLTLYMVGAIVGLAAIGSLRGAQTLVGPMSTLYVGALLASVPEMARINSVRRPGMLRMAVVISTGLAVIGAMWAAALLLIPEHWGASLLGDTWSATHSVVVPFGLYVVAEGVIVGPWAGLRGLAAAKQSLRARAIVAVATATFGCLGAWRFGAYGAAWGIGLASATAAAIWWFQFGHALRLRSFQAPVDAQEARAT